eukprot:comp20675_c0_seq1/m.42290 comp20675_c0_seq1/g.42290  ORF comp20675_c0_seq1/g.42290 comp20675_c0_seq1/m.42290 type:complete len:826 (-) comp20675_c0_seq1:448-2925(-)
MLCNNNLGIQLAASSELAQLTGAHETNVRLPQQLGHLGLHVVCLDGLGLAPRVGNVCIARLLDGGIVEIRSTTQSCIAIVHLGLGLRRVELGLENILGLGLLGALDSFVAAADVLGIAGLLDAGIVEIIKIALVQLAVRLDGTLVLGDVALRLLLLRLLGLLLERNVIGLHRVRIDLLLVVGNALLERRLLVAVIRNLLLHLGNRVLVVDERLFVRRFLCLRLCKLGLGVLVLVLLGLDLALEIADLVVELLARSGVLGSTLRVLLGARGLHVHIGLELVGGLALLLLLDLGLLENLLLLVGSKLGLGCGAGVDFCIAAQLAHHAAVLADLLGIKLAVALEILGLELVLLLALARIGFAALERALLGLELALLALQLVHSALVAAQLLAVLGKLALLTAQLACLGVEAALVAREIALLLLRLHLVRGGIHVRLGRVERCRVPAAAARGRAVEIRRLRAALVLQINALLLRLARFLACLRGGLGGLFDGLLGIGKLLRGVVHGAGVVGNQTLCLALLLLVARELVLDALLLRVGICDLRVQAADTRSLVLGLVLLRKRAGLVLDALVLQIGDLLVDCIGLALGSSGLLAVGRRGLLLLLELVIGLARSRLVSGFLFLVALELLLVAVLLGLGADLVLFGTQLVAAVLVLLLLVAGELRLVLLNVLLGKIALRERLLARDLVLVHGGLAGLFVGLEPLLALGLAVLLLLGLVVLLGLELHVGLAVACGGVVALLERVFLLEARVDLGNLGLVAELLLLCLGHRLLVAIGGVFGLVRLALGRVQALFLGRDLGRLNVGGGLLFEIRLVQRTDLVGIERHCALAVEIAV